MLRAEAVEPRLSLGSEMAELTGNVEESTDLRQPEVYQVLPAHFGRSACQE